MGHPERFQLKYVAVGNEDCDNTKPFYQGHYLKFYNAIREAYPDIQIISNCDGSSEPLDHPADLYDFHIYNSADDLFLKKDTFSRTSRTGPKSCVFCRLKVSYNYPKILFQVFVSEYAVHVDGDTSKGSLQASLAEAAFLIGLEVNSDIVHMASYAPLFVNDNDRKWTPDAIVFNSWQQYGTPSYWMQTFFGESSGAVIHPVRLNSSYSGSLAASAITWRDNEDIFLRIKIVNFGPNTVNLTLSATGLEAGVDTSRSAVTVLTSNYSLDENSFDDPLKARWRLCFAHGLFVSYG
uniref:non-reducing end alpha-L-arabinofuranosidase n=1 Tax=Aegilops tauschii TaxID=37682 RepID=M8AWF3_AEGTA